MKALVEEFRQFAIRGNALQLAVAVVVGNAFSAIVNSLVADIITPLIGLFTPNQVDFKNLALVMRAAYTSSNGVAVPALTLNYGSFFETIFNFLIVSGSIFLVFKFLSMAKEHLFKSGEEQKTPEHEKPPEERLLEEIRDLLKARSAK
ncbi:MAG: large conductance mechanosensitive channel protein MscL [Patescibacteria group bacterium]|nr:large conductance mechanosensitive channel protein MscL [Patescibacteria group bacterium]